MADPAEIRLLPDELRVIRTRVEAHVPRGGLVGALAAGLVGYLALAELAAESLAALMPLPAPVTHGGPQQVLAPVGELDGPLVPRRAVEPGTGLPPGRHHP